MLPYKTYRKLREAEGKIENEDDSCTANQVHDWLQEHREEMLSDIASLVAIDSARGEEKEGMPYGEGPYQALCEGEKILRKNGLSQVAMHGNRVITGEIGPGDEAELGILAHLDVVPVGNGWTVDPLKMTRRDGKILAAA